MRRKYEKKRQGNNKGVNTALSRVLKIPQTIINNGLAAFLCNGSIFLYFLSSEMSKLYKIRQSIEGLPILVSNNKSVCTAGV